MSLAKLLAVVLSHTSGVAFCWCPISTAVRRKIIVFWALICNAANDASAADDTIGFIIEHSTHAAPWFGSFASASDELPK